MRIERRLSKGAQFRAAVGDDGWFSQRVAVFDTPQEIYPWMIEEVAPEAFDATLREDDPVALFNHDPNKVLGRVSAKTARFTKDGVGLTISFDPGPTSIAADLRVWMGRGDVTGGSFSFVTRPNGESSREDSNGVIHRRLLAVTLYDAGPVTFPAYPDTATRSGRIAEELATWGERDADLAMQALYRVRRGLGLTAEMREVLAALGGTPSAVAVEVPALPASVNLTGAVSDIDDDPPLPPTEPEAAQEPATEEPEVVGPEPAAEPRSAISVLALRLALAKREMGDGYVLEDVPADTPEEEPLGEPTVDEYRTALEELLRMGAHDGACDFGAPCEDCGVPKRACSKHGAALRGRVEAARTLLTRA